jgi:hypothetical protein
MHIELRRTVERAIEPDELRLLLLAWAEAAGFRLAEDLPGRWEFRRGSEWHAVYTFDVRKVPAEVVVLHLPISGQIAFALTCGSIWQMATPGDRVKLEQDLDYLCAHVCEISEALAQFDEQSSERWQTRGKPGEGICRPGEGVRRLEG